MDTTFEQRLDLREEAERHPGARSDAILGLLRERITLLNKRDALEADVTRLREALALIALGGVLAPQAHDDASLMVHEMQAIASKALEKSGAR